MTIKPDKKLLTKIWLTLLTITSFVLIPMVSAHIIINIFDPQDADKLMPILWLVAAGLLAAMWIITIPVAILWVKHLSYQIKDDRIIIHKGILARIQQNIPFRAITDFMLYRSLYDRFLGTGVIRVQTAGQSANATGYEGQLSGLIDWESLHVELKNRLKKIHGGTSPTTVAGGGNDSEVSAIEKMLVELRKIRELLEKAQK